MNDTSAIPVELRDRPFELLALEAVLARLTELEQTTASELTALARQAQIDELGRMLKFAASQKRIVNKRLLAVTRETERIALDMAQGLNALAPGATPVDAGWVLANLDEIAEHMAPKGRQ